MDLILKGRVAVITGGASGVGRAAAQAFAAEGAHVALWDLGDAAAIVADEIRETFSVRAISLSADVAEEGAVASAAERTVQELGAIDHLAHAAAIGSGKFGFPFTNLLPSDWPRVLRVNVMGMAHVAHAVAPRMVGRATGTMVFVVSVARKIGSQTDPPYSTSKAANINFAQCLAKDLAPHGVRVNTVCPGMVQTPMNRSVWQAWQDQAPAAERLTYEEWSNRKIHAVVPLGRWQTPEAISDRAAHVTGQTVNLDGGFVMHW